MTEMPDTFLLSERELSQLKVQWMKENNPAVYMLHRAAWLAGYRVNGFLPNRSHIK